LNVVTQLHPHDRRFFSTLFLWSFGTLIAVVLVLGVWQQQREAERDQAWREHARTVQADGIAQRGRIEAMVRALCAREGMPVPDEIPEQR
jgi:cytochrome oxidase assembly protein ShyY1